MTKTQWNNLKPGDVLFNPTKNTSWLILERLPRGKGGKYEYRISVLAKMDTPLTFIIKAPRWITEDWQIISRD